MSQIIYIFAFRRGNTNYLVFSHGTENRTFVPSER